MHGDSRNAVPGAQPLRRDPAHVQSRKQRWYKGWLRGTWIYIVQDKDFVIIKAIGVFLFGLLQVDDGSMIVEALMNLIPGGQAVDVAYIPEVPSALLLWIVACRFLKMRKKIAFYRRYW